MQPDTAPADAGPAAAAAMQWQCGDRPLRGRQLIGVPVPPVCSQPQCPPPDYGNGSLGPRA